MNHAMRGEWKSIGILLWGEASCNNEGIAEAKERAMHSGPASHSPSVGWEHMGTKGDTSSDFKYFLLSFYFSTAFSPILSVISDHHFKTTCSSGNSSYSFVEAFMIVSKTFQAIILFNIGQSHSLSGYWMHVSFSSVSRVAWLCCVREVWINVLN